MGQLGFMEIVVIFIVALLVFGPKKLPELGKSLGKGLREFKKATNDLKSSWEEQIRDAEDSVHEVKKTLNETTREINRDLNAPAYQPPQDPTVPTAGDPEQEPVREEVRSDGSAN